MQVKLIDHVALPFLAKTSFASQRKDRYFREKYGEDIAKAIDVRPCCTTVQPSCNTVHHEEMQLLPSTCAHPVHRCVVCCEMLVFLAHHGRLSLCANSKSC